MNVEWPGNVAIPIGPNNANGPNSANELRITKADMGEIVDLERYRKLRRRREAEAKKVKRGGGPDNGKAENPNASPAVKQAEPGRTGAKGAAKARDDDSKSD